MARYSDTYTEIAVDNITISGNTIISTDTNGNINLTPNGTGAVVINGPISSTTAWTTTSKIVINADGTALNAAGSITLGAGQDAGAYFDGTDLVIITDGAGASGIIFDSEDDTFEFKGSGTLQATFNTNGLNLVTGDYYSINGTSVLNATTLGSAVVASSLTSVGTLTSLAVAGDVTITAAAAPSLTVTDSTNSAYVKLLTSDTDLTIQTDGPGTNLLHIKMNGGGTTAMSFNKDGKMSTGGETAPDVDAGGICINQGAGDAFLLTFKSSDIAHGTTDEAETDTYGAVRKYSATTGGLNFRGFSEASTATLFESYAVTEITTDTSSSEANIVLNAIKQSGTGRGAHGATGNLLTIANNGSAQFLCKGNGDLHATNTTITALDDEDDLSLVENLKNWTGGENYQYKVTPEQEQKLRDIGVIRGDFLSLQTMHALELGAISQMTKIMNYLGDKLGLTEADLRQIAMS